MVKLVSFLAHSKSVLYSERQNTWKIADFGMMTPGTSKNSFSTVYSRGTPSYRAPELLAILAHYSQKSDIWALGCIFYQICTGRKAFEDDWAVRDYSLAGDQVLCAKTLFLSDKEDAASSVMGGMIRAMLAIKPSARPTAKVLEDSFNEMCHRSNSVSFPSNKSIIHSRNQYPDAKTDSFALGNSLSIY